MTKKYDSANWCMHGGLILDEYNAVMRDVTRDPQKIYVCAIKTDYVCFFLLSFQINPLILHYNSKE